MGRFTNGEINNKAEHQQALVPSSITSLVASKPRESFTYTSEDYSVLSQNEYYRFLNNSDTIGHAVIHFNGKKTTASQYAMPTGDKSAPEWVPLKNIHPIQRYGMTFFAAETLDGVPMYSNRSYQCIDEKGEKFEIRPFSPPPSHRKEPFWGSQSLVPITYEPTSGYEEVYKAGRELTVEKQSIDERSQIKRRKPTQNQVMGRSAKVAYEEFLAEWKDDLTPEMQMIFQRAIDAPLRNMFYSNYRPEWLHAEGYSLTPMSINPQREANLGSAPKWANTAMMVLERIAKWFALNCPQALVTIKPTFEMLLESDLIKSIDFDVQVGLKNRYLRFIQHLEPLQQKAPVFKKASDIAQLTGIAHAMLNDKQPVAQDVLRSYKPFFSLQPSRVSPEDRSLESQTFNGKPSVSAAHASFGIFRAANQSDEKKSGRIYQADQVLSA